MNTVFKALSKSLIYNKSLDSSNPEYCCLCFGEVTDATYVEDELLLQYVDNGTKETAQLYDMLAYMLGEEFIEVMSSFKAVCPDCTNTAVISYKFMKMCRDNSDHLYNAVSNLTDCFNNTVPDDHLSSFKSMFAVLDVDKQQIVQYYDKKPQVVAPAAALSRLECLMKKSEEKPPTPPKKMYEGFTVMSDEPPVKQRDHSTIFIKTAELVHDPSNPRNYKCKMCLKTYPTATNLRAHFFSVHFKKDFQCECGKRFGTVGLLLRHKNESHRTVVCNICNKVLLNRANTLKKHRMSHQKVMMCDSCGRTFKKREYFKKHIEENLCQTKAKGEKNFICDHCSKKFSTKYQLATHIRYEHDHAKGHICQWCNRNCYNASALKIHILKHTKEKNHVCTECGGRFVTQQSLIQHFRLHTGERPYKCEDCGQGFLSASRRNDHYIRYHVGTVFACDLCDCKYNAKRSLMKHKRTH